MDFHYMKITPEKDGAVLVFDEAETITAMFNPNKLSFSKSVAWQPGNANQRDVPELQFTNGDSRTLTLDLMFDTYDTPSDHKTDVRDHTRKLSHLTTVATHGDKHRPPVCRLSWGAASVFFQGVLQNITLQLTLFMPDGTPVRATSNCVFQEWYTNYADLQHQKLESSDVSKIRIVKRGETLSSIAAAEYRDPCLWRAIANENSIYDPLDLHPGMKLLIPALRKRVSGGGFEYD